MLLYSVYKTIKLLYIYILLNTLMVWEEIFHIQILDLLKRSEDVNQLSYNTFDLISLFIINPQYKIT